MSPTYTQSRRVPDMCDDQFYRFQECGCDRAVDITCGVEHNNQERRNLDVAPSVWVAHRHHLIEVAVPWLLLFTLFAPLDPRLTSKTLSF
ncbi:hypothetical protein IAQ61_009119 [Plenodomus lingam]|uniref:uncharacterized protein n=1 Tax=Leptosphaeria maculans TaxID=5022 RepID=UPI003330F8C0|nr:hypothetical protein IAQ61_009119 [Plenodomus lingam]